MIENYEPRGRVKVLLEAMGDEPGRVWTVEEIAVRIDLPISSVHAYLAYPVRVGALFRGRRNRELVLAIRPFPEQEQDTRRKYKPQAKPVIPPAWTPRGDIRIPQVVAGWRPPVMVPPRSCA